MSNNNEKNESAKNTENVKNTESAKNTENNAVPKKPGILSHFSKLKQKKFFIPLIVGHIIMFAALGYFVYDEEEEHKNTPRYLTETLNKSLEINDPVLFAQIFNVAMFIDNTYNTMTKSLSEYPDFALYIKALPNAQDFSAALSVMLLDILKTQDTAIVFDEALDLIPDKLASQLRKTPFTLNLKASDPENNIYVIETKLDTIKWGTYPLMLTAILQDDIWSITEITNLTEIIQIYDSELKRVRTRQENRTIADKSALLEQISQYLLNPTCVASITELSGQKVLIVRIDTETNVRTQDIVSWGAQTSISFKDGSIFKEEYLKINGLFSPPDPISNTWNLSLTDEDTKKLQGQELLCTTQVVFVNLSNGEFFEIVK